MKCYVYGLKDTLNNQIRYIGITVNLKQRLQDHLKPSKAKENTYKSNWINKIKKLNQSIYLEVIEECDSWEEACQKEIYYISIYKNLTNLS